MFVFGQDEKYIHIDEMEMMKVEKCVSEVVEWMNNAVSAQAKKSLDQDPAVLSSEIKGKLQVSTIRNYLWRLVQKVGWYLCLLSSPVSSWCSSVFER